MDVEGSGVPHFHVLPQNFPVKTEEKTTKALSLERCPLGEDLKMESPKYQ
jgi:hypothetical protein